MSRLLLIIALLLFTLQLEAKKKVPGEIVDNRGEVKKVTFLVPFEPIWNTVAYAKFLTSVKYIDENGEKQKLGPFSVKEFSLKLKGGIEVFHARYFEKSKHFFRVSKEGNLKVWVYYVRKWEDFRNPATDRVRKQAVYYEEEAIGFDYGELIDPFSEGGMEAVRAIFKDCKSASTAMIKKKGSKIDSKRGVIKWKTLYAAVDEYNANCQ